MTQSVSGRRRFLALVFPFLAADLIRLTGQRSAPGTRAGASQAESLAQDAPLVFTVKQSGGFRLHALDTGALALGLEPGMPLADARARVPDLVALPHDPDGEARLLARLADQCDRFTPMVAIDVPEGIVLDIAGCTHLFGEEIRLARDAVRLMRAQGMRVAHARADTPEAALALARFGERSTRNRAGAMGRLPLLALRVAPDVIHALRRAGFTCIGDLANLPPAPLAARFGASLVDALDRLLARTDSRITPRRSLPPIWTERRFAEPIAHIDTVMMVLCELLETVCGELAERAQGGRRFLARLYRSDGATRDLAVETGQPIRDPALVRRLFNERVEALSDPLDPGFGFDIIRLAVPAVEALGVTQAALDGERSHAADLAALLDRLMVRGGARRFRRLAPRDTHIPERVTRLVASMVAGAPGWDAPLPNEPPLRPLALFDPPERIEAIAQVPDGPPRQFRWRGAVHRIVAQEGPERIAPEWWRRERGHDGDPGLTRDYYRVEDEAGQRFWLFRHGLYERETAQPLWYVHGLFA